MPAPTEEEMFHARLLAEHLVELLPDFINRIWLTSWRGLRLIYDTNGSKNCLNDCASCSNRELLIEGLPDTEESMILTDLHRWESDKDKRLYGPEKFLACKTTPRFVGGYVACMLYDPEYRDVAKLVDELELVRDSRLIWSSRGESPVDVQRQLQQSVIKSVIPLADPEQRLRINQALSRLGWDGNNFA